MSTQTESLDGIDAEALAQLSCNAKADPSTGVKTLKTKTVCESGFRDMTYVRELDPVLVSEPSQLLGDNSASGPHVGVRTRVMRQVVVLDVAGRLRDVVEDLDRAIELALAEGPRGVVCDLAAVLEGAEPGAVEVLAGLGRHVRDWRGIPVAVACPDPQVREVLAAHPVGGQLIVTASLFSAVSAVLATPALAVEWLHLAPHPTAPRASRDFVARTLLDWRLGRVIRFASPVISELVMSSTVNAGTDIDVSVAWHLGTLRLSVRDYSPSFARQRYSALGLHGPRLSMVAGLTRAFGVLPTADGGTLVWAVLDAPAAPNDQHRPRRVPDDAIRKSPRFTDAVGLGGLPFCAETGPHRTGDRVPRPPSAAPAQ